MPLKKGHNIGKKFSSTYQPQNRGRKKSKFRLFMEALEEKGENLSMEDYQKTITRLLTLTPAELKEVANNKDAPLVLVIIASAISGDIESKSMGNIEKMADRAFGKALAKTEVTGKDGSALIPSIQVEVIDSRDKVDNNEDSND